MTAGIYERTPAIERLLDRVSVTLSGCWEWQGAQNGKGYGVFGNGGQQVYVHRFAYEYFKGEIPQTLEIDHLCRNRRCVNPDHLEVVTRQVNQLRGMSVSGQAARKTHCPQGHLYDLFNTRFYKSGGRICRTCDKIRKRREVMESLGVRFGKDARCRFQ